MIFDSFPSIEAAGRFCDAVEDIHGLTTALYETESEAQAVDPFPYELHAPIVHVERHEDFDTEQTIELAVIAYGGKFAGT